MCAEVDACLTNNGGCDPLVSLLVDCLSWMVIAVCQKCVVVSRAYIMLCVWMCHCTLCLRCVECMNVSLCSVCMSRRVAGMHVSLCRGHNVVSYVWMFCCIMLMCRAVVLMCHCGVCLYRVVYIDV